MSNLIAPTDSAPLVQLTRQGTICGSLETLAPLRAQFQQQHYFRLPQLIEPALLDVIQEQIEQGEFYERVHERIDSNKELCLRENAASTALLFLINDEKLFEIIQQLTECETIRCFDGRIYRAAPGNGHHDSWHNDVGDNRLAGISINLSREEYSGGVLQLRERESGETISEITNVRAGDAVVFRLARSLQHRISEVTGKTPKTALAGWFKAHPHFSQLLAPLRSEDSKPMKPNPNVLSKRLGEEMVLFNLDTDHFYELNGSAARFWELLNVGSDDAAVRQQMLAEFEVDPEQLASEAEALMASFRQEGLVTGDE